MNAPSVGDRFIATDNAGAVAALCGPRYPVPRGGPVFVTIESVYPEHQKVKVLDGLWLTFTELAQWFRPVQAKDGGTT